MLYEVITQNVERADFQASFTNVFLQQRFLLRANLNIIVENNRLSIEMEALEFRIVLTQPQQVIDELDQTHMMLLVWQIPFTIPVAV